VRITDCFAGPTGHGVGVEITIRLDELAPPVGEAGKAGSAARPFVGWLGLLALLGELLQTQPPAEVPGSLGGEGHPGAEPDLGEDM